MFHYYIYKKETYFNGKLKPARAFHWFSVYDIHQTVADGEVSNRRHLFTQNQWTVFKTPEMLVVPDISTMPELLPKLYVWEPSVKPAGPPWYPYSFSLYTPVAARFGKRAVGYYLGMWPKYEDYVARPNDPSIWPIRGLIVAANIALQRKLRTEMDYRWRSQYRLMGRRNVPDGYIPLHFIDECYFLDNKYPWRKTRGCRDRGLPWTEYEPSHPMVWPALPQVRGTSLVTGLDHLRHV